MIECYRLRERARNDLEEIWRYTYHIWGLKQADTYLNSIIDRCEWLAENPLLGKRRDDLRRGYRCFPEGSHMIYYVVDAQVVNVIGILHQNMDTGTQFTETPE